MVIGYRFSKMMRVAQWRWAIWAYRDTRRPARLESGAHTHMESGACL